MIRSKMYEKLLWTMSTQCERKLHVKKLGPCVISCKNKKFNFHLGTKYANLDTIPLVSKGWGHSKSSGDYFIINPVPDTEDYKKPCISFSEIHIKPELQKTLLKEGIKAATKFQSEAIPEIFKENHVLLGAETGCGKTLCYLLPLLQSISDIPDDVTLNSPKVLVLVPNRELAYQVGEMAHILSEPLNLKAKVLVGGSTKKKMMNPEFEKIDILIATPGALGKLATVGIYKLNNVLSTVLDEADTLTDDSFEERITGILRKVPESRIVLVAATIPKHLPDILKPIEPNLTQIISPQVHKPLLNITQSFMRLSRTGRVGHLLQIIKTTKEQMLVFTNRNETCNWLAMFAREHGVSCSNINGDMNYAIRIEQWNDFVKGKTKILSATDVGSRGLDTTQVRQVLNYEFPLYAADYLHRIGRVGRIGSPANCKVTNFITGGQEINLVHQIELCIRRGEALSHVDGNITNLIQRKIERSKREVI